MDDVIPAIEITQWRAGRVLTEDDVQFLQQLLREHDDEMNRRVDEFAAGREQALRELGGQEFVDLDTRGMEIDGKLAFKRACIRVAERQAELDRLSQ